MRPCQQFLKLDWRQGFVLVVPFAVLNAGAGGPFCRLNHPRRGPQEVDGSSLFFVKAAKLDVWQLCLM
jgi:hypothetical protein